MRHAPIGWQGFLAVIAVALTVAVVVNFWIKADRDRAFYFCYFLALMIVQAATLLRI
jgi:hypothetical protein